MFDETPDLTFDDIYGEIRNDNEKSIDFFQGSEIVILKNENYLDTIEKQDTLVGLESLIGSFSASKERIAFNQLIAGNEAYDNGIKKRSIVLTVIEEIIRFIKNVGRWIYSLIANRIARIDIKLGFLEQRRKVKGIKNRPVRYLLSSETLLIPSTLTENPHWVIDNAGIGLAFYKRTIDAYKKLLEFTSARPTSVDELKEQKKKVLEGIGRIISNGKVSKTGFVTDILPGNKVFNIDIKTTEREGSILYFTDYVEAIKKPSTWEPSSGVIDAGMVMLNKFVTEIKKEQTTTLTLTRNFESRIKAIKTDASPWTTAYYNWLIELNRRLVSVTFQHTMRWFDALEGFVSSGVN